MAQVEHAQKCSNSSSGGGGGGGNGGGGISSSGRSSKRLKQKKVPQRGLGVAQLEKIRLEEQQKKDAALQAQAVDNILSPHAMISPSNSSSCLAVQGHTFRPSVSPSSMPSPNDLSSVNSFIRPAPSMAEIDVLHPNHQLPLSKSLCVGGGGDVGWSAMPGPGHGGTWPKLWNGEGESGKIDHHGLAFRPNLHLPYEPNPSILHLPGLVQRSQQFQQPCSSMVNLSSGISPSSSLSLQNFQMEPPSNQSYCGNKYTPLWPEEEKMVGLKRQYPFSLEVPPAPPFHCKFPSSMVASIAQSDESASCSNGYPANIEPSNQVIREGPSSLNILSEPNPRSVIGENGHLDGDFLTLAPPTASSQHSILKYKQPSANPGPSRRELSITSQESSEDPFQRPRTSGSTIQPFFSFLPSAKVQIVQAAKPLKSDTEVGESVDLNLKL